MKIIARIYTDFKEKFGIPRQSGLVATTRGKIVFEEEYRDPTALRGLEGFSHLWLIWQFSERRGEGWSPTVRPPRLGGNRRVGVFATRSPNRPNPIGLSSVKLAGMARERGHGVVLYVEGADLLDGTPIYDIKPYLAFTDSHPEATGGFADERFGKRLTVGGEALETLGEAERAELCELLAEDPRPSYQNDEEREYGMKLGEREIFFKVAGGALTVTRIEKAAATRVPTRDGTSEEKAR